MSLPLPRLIPTAFAALMLGTAAAPSSANLALAQKHACTACHAVERKVVGPSYADVAKKYAGQADAARTLAASIKAGGAGKWGPVPMPPQAQLGETELAALAAWILGGAK